MTTTTNGIETRHNLTESLGEKDLGVVVDLLKELWHHGTLSKKLLCQLKV